MSIDWPQLRAAAVDVAGRAYAPYSRLRVGAAGLTADGQGVVGCTVENASFGVTLCAECGLVSAWHATPPRSSGPGSVASGATPALVAVAVVAGYGDPLLPCGRCRQLLLEAGGGGRRCWSTPRAGRSRWPSCCRPRSAARTCPPAGRPTRRLRRSLQEHRRCSPPRPGERHARRRIADPRQAR